MDPAIIAWHLDIIYEVIGGKRRLETDDGDEEQWWSRLGRKPANVRNARKVHAVKDVSFIVERGESVGIVGRNGSGKSTLLRALAGLVPPTNGQVWTQGQPSLLGVNAVLVNQLTGERNIYVGGKALGLTTEQVRERYDDIVNLADIGDAIHRPMSTYSSGQSARLRFAISTIARPEILMIDEALATGDAAFKKKSQGRVEELLANASTVFFVSHSNKTVVEMCTRALWLDQGRLIMDGPADEVVTAYAKGTVSSTGRRKAAPPPQIDLGPGLESLTVADQEPQPCATAVVWSSSALAAEQSRQDFITGIMASINHGGVANFLVDAQPTGTDTFRPDCLLPLPPSGDTWTYAGPELLRELGFSTDQIIVVDSDPDSSSAVFTEWPQSTVLRQGTAETDEFLTRLVDQHQTLEIPAAEPIRTALARQQKAVASDLSTESFLNLHPIHLVVLDQLYPMHLAPDIEHLVNTTTTGNRTSSRLAVGRARQLCADLRNNRCFVLTGWDEFGSMGVIGFAVLNARSHELQHFVIADRVVGLGVEESFAEYLIANGGASASQLSRGDQPWIRFESVQNPDVWRALSTQGLVDDRPAEIAIAAGLDTGKIAANLGEAAIRWPASLRDSLLKQAAEVQFDLDAPLVGYWAGGEYSDRIWGSGQPGLDHYRRMATNFCQTIGEANLVILLPREEFDRQQPTLGHTPERFREFNEVWRTLADGSDSIELLNVGDLAAMGDPKTPIGLSSQVIASFSQHLRERLGTSQQSFEKRFTPQHLRLVAHLEGEARLTENPLPVAADCDGIRARRWEIEVVHESDFLLARGGLVLMDFDDSAAILEGRDVTAYAQSSAQYYHYLDTQNATGSTRFIVEASAPVTPTMLALQTWGKRDANIRINAVRIWVHRETPTSTLGIDPSP